ncbi:PKD domain-containing protein [Neolewinella persica]|uniref:PKD domain-containing protein n=1 Tax=Neolewinella persica TaxID=70998 RepID=UPI00036FBF7E|nr:PKD domain-containing protein [Neolewinella persica]
MKFLFSSLALLFCALLSAQNSYHVIVEINSSEQWLRSTAAQGADDQTRLLIYQHGGADINLSGSNIGRVSATNGAGHYDLNKVIGVNGDTLFLAFPITHDYALASTQLVVYQSWNEVSVTGEQLVSQPYDGTTGGVIFLAAESRISLEKNAVLHAEGSGFRGAAGRESDSNCNRFTSADGEVYDLANWRGSPRGEGIAGVPAGQEAGRAFAANGGGGGNDHNSGGGGGANSGPGGNGARNIVMGLLNNACRGNFPGWGGSGLITNHDILYFGGGGGAGHANNTNMASGGNGGGLIVLWAPTINFDVSSRLDVSGLPGQDVNGDGGGGGGAAGSILLIADTLRGNPAIDLSGGKGGDVTNAPDRCFGPGGGGSGGRMISAARARSAFSPVSNFSQGGPGLRLGSNECGPNDEPAGVGSVGNETTILYPVPFGGFTQSADTLCGGEQLLITDASLGSRAVTWEVLPEVPGVTVQPVGLSLRIFFADSVRGTFRAIQTLQTPRGFIYPGDTATFTVFPNPVVETTDIIFDDEFVSVNLTGANGFDSIRYDFGDGTIIDTNVVVLDHTYQEGGTYLVTVTLLNANCGDLVAGLARTILPEFSVAEISLKDVDGCAPLTFSIADISTGTYDDRKWNFPGGSPETSQEANPEVTYTEPGTYEITLTLFGAVGNDTIRTIPVRIYAQPTAELTASVDTSAATFVNLSLNATEHYWNFGDDSLSMEAEPTHTYAATGSYEVTYVAINGPCRDTLLQDVVIDVLSEIRELAELGVKLFPNPTTGVLQVSGPAQIIGAYDLRGRVLGLPVTDQSLDLSQQPAGTYIIRVLAGGHVFAVPIIVQ